jgi:hypothetical protein
MSRSHDDHVLPLLGRLVRTFHLNVPDRRLLPWGRLPATMLCRAVIAEVKQDGVLPPEAVARDGFNGGILTIARDGNWTIQWWVECGVGRTTLLRTETFEVPDIAAAAWLKGMFPGDDIDGLPIDWLA